MSPWNITIIADPAAIGVLGVSDTGLLKPGLFDGVSVALYTYAGDVNLDDVADENDWTIVNNHQNTTGTWERGDLNYDGNVDGSDLNLVAASEFSPANRLPAAVEGQPYAIPLAAAGRVLFAGPGLGFRWPLTSCACGREANRLLRAVMEVGQIAYFVRG